MFLKQFGQHFEKYIEEDEIKDFEFESEIEVNSELI